MWPRTKIEQNCGINTINGTPGYRYFVDAFCYAGDKTGYDEKAYSSVVKTAVR